MGIVGSPGYALIPGQPGIRALKANIGPHDALESRTAPLPAEGVTAPGARVGTQFFIVERKFVMKGCIWMCQSWSKK